MEVLPPRPYRLDPLFITWRVVGAAFLAIWGGGTLVVAVAEFGGRLFLLVGGIAFGLACGVLARRILRQLMDMRRIAADSAEVALDLVGIEPVFVKRTHNANKVSVRLHGDASTIVDQLLPPTEQPLFTDRARTHVVALVSKHAPERPWIVRESLYPFLLSDDVRAAIRMNTRR